jgi:chemotaxis protein histidine kinase CheA
MTSNDELRRAFDTLADRLRNEMSRQLNTALDEMATVAVSAEAARKEAADAAQQEYARKLEAAEAERQHALEAARKEAAEAARKEAADAAQAEFARKLEAAEAERQHALEAARKEAAEAARKEAADTAQAEFARKLEAAEAERQQALDAARKEAAEAARREAADAAQQEFARKLEAADAERQRAIEAARREGADAARLEFAKEQEEREKREAQERRERREGREGREGQEGRDAEERAARLLDAIRAIDRARSLTDILDALVDHAAREAGRAAVLLARGGRFRGWRFAGFGPDFENATSIEIAPAHAGVMNDAFQSGAPATGGHIPPFAHGANADSAIAIPLAIAGDIVAVMYADRGTQDRESQSATAKPLAPSPIIEVLARHACRCLESVTAFKAASALMTPSDASARSMSGDGGAIDDASADEDVAARRYAKLLVSEIKLYHEAAVIAGRLERDLGTRLGGEIARARVLYDQRVPAHVRQHADYFHDELVRTLANGDARLLEVRS